MVTSFSECSGDSRDKTRTSARLRHALPGACAAAVLAAALSAPVAAAATDLCVAAEW